MAKGFKFEDRSKQVKRQLEDASMNGLEAAALVVESSAKAKASVDSGELRDKIDHRVFKKGNSGIAQIGSPLDYAFYPEFGTGEFAENGAGRKGGWSYKDEEGNWHYTKGQKPKPYLRPAFRSNKQKIEQIIGHSLSSNFKGK